MKDNFHRNSPEHCNNVKITLAEVINDIGPAIVACSGGVDSLLLATIIHRSSPTNTIIAHAHSPAVPRSATLRVRDIAMTEGWNLELIQSGEFSDESYRSNPINRCYYCKFHLYTALSLISNRIVSGIISKYTIVSGANIDDTFEYRPGLNAAHEFKVRHPFIEAGIGKENIRDIARSLNLQYAELPASPCLASRIYTGTPVTEIGLATVNHGEEFLKQATGIQVIRCRIREDRMYIEVNNNDRCKINYDILKGFQEKIRSINSEITEVYLDPLPYLPGRAFIRTK